MSESMNGAQALAGALLRMGTSHVYGIVGTSNVGFVNALYELRDRIRYVSCRHEQVAASMSDTEGRLTGRPGVTLVHSGPGALNALISVGDAYKDSSPMIVITGAVKRRLTGSDGMLELDHLKEFSPLCKGTYRVETAAMIPEVFADAFRAAMSGSRGPVLIEVPEDVWAEAADIDLDRMKLEVDPPPVIEPEEVREALDTLKSARYPLVLSGGGVAYSGSSDAMVRLAETLRVPVITTGNGRGTIPETHPLCLGRAGFGGGSLVADKALERADALLCLGAGISDMTTYEFTSPVKAERITVVNISPGSIAPQAPESRLLLCDVSDFLRSALEELGDYKAPGAGEWDEALKEPRAIWQGMLEASLNRSGERPPGARVARGISERVPDDTIVSVGAGIHLLFAMDFMPCLRPLTFMSTVNFGSMGFGFPACLAAKLIYPERYAVSIIGDGDFMMTVQDLETAVREMIGIKIFVINDYKYGVLNMRQKMQLGGNSYGTEHGNPDFARLAETFGATGLRLEDAGNIDTVLDAAVAAEGPVVVDVIVDPEDLPPLNIEANLRMSAGS